MTVSSQPLTQLWCKQYTDVDTFDVETLDNFLLTTA